MQVRPNTVNPGINALSYVPPANVGGAFNQGYQQEQSRQANALSMEKSRFDMDKQRKAQEAQAAQQQAQAEQQKAMQGITDPNQLVEIVSKTDPIKGMELRQKFAKFSQEQNTAFIGQMNGMTTMMAKAKTPQERQQIQQFYQSRFQQIEQMAAAPGGQDQINAFATANTPAPKTPTLKQVSVIGQDGKKSVNFVNPLTGEVISSVDGGYASKGTSLTTGPDGQINFSQGGYGSINTPFNALGANAGRDQKQLGKKMSDADAALLAKERESAQGADEIVALSDKLGALLPNVGYTGIGGELLGGIDNIIGVLPGEKGARAAFQSAAVEAQLSFVAKTKGAVTEREMALFASAAPGLTKTGEGNENIIQSLRAGAERTKNRAFFMEEYVDRNGSLQGAQRQWNQYINENPIFQAGDDGTLSILPEGDWTSYIEQSPANAKVRTMDEMVTDNAITNEDLEFTAKKHGISVEEVKNRLGL